MSARELITEHLDLWTGAITKKSSSGRGSNGKVELTGVKKLRELILELAVRGKLVAQDDTDEPAKDLLSRIAKEKSELILVGRLKKQRALPPISESDTPYSLPSKWTWTRLGNYGADIHYGYTASADEHLSEYRLLRITDIQNDKVNWATVPGCEISKQQAEPYLLSENDILIARTGGTIGKSFLVQDINVNAVFASYLIRLKKLEATYARYVKVFLGSHTYWSQLYEASMGTGQPNVNGKSLKNLLFPVPPMEEQHRIVQKVDELMALCDRLEQQTSDQLEAHETLVDTLLGTLTQSENATELADNWARLAAHFDTLFTTEQSIDKLKKTILQLAVMGRLVEQDVGDEPASDLIQRINAERLKLEREGKARVANKAARVDVVEPLPGAWAKCKLGTCISLISGQHLKGDEYFDDERPDSIPYLTGPAEFGVQTPEPQRHTFEKRAVAEKGDILITCKGSGVGKLNIASRDIAISRQLMAARPIVINARFLYLLLDSLRDAIRDKTVGIAIPGISRGDILDADIHLPPLAEQHRIVQKVDELMTLCDQLKERLNQASETRCHLAEAVVEGALN